MILRVLSTALLLLLCTLPVSAWAQHCQPKVKPGVSTCGSKEMALPDKSMDGLGALTFHVSTINQDAQKFFDQGLTLHYAFNNEAAILAFKKAAELDESLAMAHWGIALAATTNINVTSDGHCTRMAIEHIKRAQEKASGISPMERDLINALGARFPSAKEQDEKHLADNYSLAMAQVHEKYPSDADVATLYADSLMNLHPWRLWEHCEPRPWTPEILRVLKSVLGPGKATRKHLGANHFYIHAMEGSCEAREASPSADVLREANLTAAGHLVHMPSHIAMRVGDYEQAAKDNEAAVAADKKVYAAACDREDKEQCLPLYVGHYLGHNLFFELAANQQLGRLVESQKLALELEQRTPRYVENEPGLEHYLSANILTLARFRKWKEVLDVPPPSTELTMAQAVWWWSRTLARAARKEKEEKITAEYQHYLKAASEVSASLSWGNNKAVAFLPLMSYLLSGQLAEHRGDWPKAIELYKLALKEQDFLIYDEPNPWPLNVRETLGGAYLRNGQFLEAQGVFLEDLDRPHNPGNGRSLFGRWKSLEGQCSQGAGQSEKGQSARLASSGPCQSDAMKRAKLEFDKAWRLADVKLTIEDL